VCCFTNGARQAIESVDEEDVVPAMPGVDQHAAQARAVSVALAPAVNELAYGHPSLTTGTSPQSVQLNRERAQSLSVSPVDTRIQDNAQLSRRVEVWTALYGTDLFHCLRLPHMRSFPDDRGDIVPLVLRAL
jgi:hypothetical protein